MKLPTTRWLIQHASGYIEGEKTFPRAVDAIAEYAKRIGTCEESFDNLDECAKVLRVTRADLCYAVWRRAKREGVKLIKVSITEVK